eukprot:6466090-Prymnesium_polylepis.1
MATARAQAPRCANSASVTAVAARQTDPHKCTIAKPAQLILHADVVGNGDGFGGQLEGEHGERGEDEEEKDAFCRGAESVAGTGSFRVLASLDCQYARVQEDQRQMRQRCE